MSSLADMQQFCLWQTKCLSEICHTSITFAKHHKAILYAPSGGHLIKLITSITHNRPCLTAWLHKGRISKESTIFLSIGSERIKNSIKLLAMEDNTWKLVSDYLFKANPIRFTKLAFLNNLFLSLSKELFPSCKWKLYNSYKGFYQDSMLTSLHAFPLQKSSEHFWQSGTKRSRAYWKTYPHIRPSYPVSQSHDMTTPF